MRIEKLLPGLLILILVACESESVSPVTLLVKEIEDPTCYRDHFTYTSSRLATFQRFFGDREETSIKFYYSGDKLTRIENVRDQGLETLIELMYNEDGRRGQEKVTVVYNGDTTYVRTGLFTYINEDVQSVTYSYEKPDIPGLECEFQWNNGNLTRMDFYSLLNNKRSRILQRLCIYDNKFNYSNEDLAFIYTVGMGDETKVSRNNLVSMQDIFVDDVSYEGGKLAFTYNEAGYPVEYVYSVSGQEFTPIQIRYY